APGVFINAGMFRKSAGGGTTTVPLTFTNTGTLEVDSGTVALTGNFTNDPAGGSILAGGTYLLRGTLQLSQAGSITALAAALTLDGTGARVVGASGNDLLAGLSANLAEGSLTVRGGRTLALSGGFTNAGAVSLAPGSALTVAGAYTQPGGSTALGGGRLSATGGVSLQGGSLAG